MSGLKNTNESMVKNYGFCSYPSCRHKKIEETEPVVEWHGVSFSVDQVQDRLSPIAKLAAVSNPEEYVEKYGRYSFNMELHPECAAEWGMHLIQDALKADYNLGSKLRNTRDAIRK